MDRLETIDEIASASSLSLEKSDEELELSGLVRSYRDIKRNSGPSVNAPEAYQEVVCKYPPNKIFKLQIQIQISAGTAD